MSSSTMSSSKLSFCPSLSTSISSCCSFTSSRIMDASRLVSCRSVSWTGLTKINFLDSGLKSRLGVVTTESSASSTSLASVSSSFPEVFSVPAAVVFSMSSFFFFLWNSAACALSLSVFFLDFFLNAVWWGLPPFWLSCWPSGCPLVLAAMLNFLGLIWGAPGLPRKVEKLM